MRPIRIILPLVALMFSCLFPADILAQSARGKEKAVVIIPPAEKPKIA